MRHLKYHRGQLRERISFEFPIHTADQVGGHNISWQNVITVWAHIEVLSSRRATEVVEAQRWLSTEFYRVTMRHQPDINTAMRILYQGQVLIIHKVTPFGQKKQWLEIIAEKGEVQ